MKTFITLIALLVAVTANAQKLLRTDSVYISGKINNFNAVKDRDNPVNVWVNELALGKPITYRGRIFDDGTYSISFLKTGTQEVNMGVCNGGAILLVSPGDHLVMNFDALRPQNSLKFNGDNAQTNHDYQAYQLARTKDNGDYWKTRYQALERAQRLDSADAHKKFLKYRYNKESAFLAQYLKTHKVTPIFASWARADLKYEYLTNLMRYPWMHRFQKGEDDNYFAPDNYYGFVKESDLNDVDATISSKYQEYITEYIKLFDDKNLAVVHDRNGWIDLYLKDPPGIKRDVILSRLIYQPIYDRVIYMLKPYIDKYKATPVSQPAIKNSVLRIYDAKTTNYPLPLNAHINTRPQTSADSVFNKILAKYPGKVVYVNLWAVGYWPSSQEMPSSNILYKQLAGKDVVFLYLAVRSSEKGWLAAIAEMGIAGEHFLLENNDVKALGTKFQFYIQHYILIDKEGKIVDNNAKRPGDRRINAEIEKLIAAN